MTDDLNLAGLALAHLRMHITSGTPSDIRMARILADELKVHAKEIIAKLSKPTKAEKQTKNQTKRK